MILINGWRHSSSITPPTFIQEAETAWNTTTSPKTTASFNCNSGDVLVAYSVVEDHANDVAITSSLGGALIWTEQQKVLVTNFCTVQIWTATLGSTTSLTVTFTSSAGTRWFGGNVFTFRGSSGVGASNKTNVATGAPSLTFSTSYDNSALVVVNGDWGAIDGASRTWRTVNSITPTSGNGMEQTYFRDASHYTVYGAYYTDAGTAGSKTVGLSAPSGQTYSIVGVEIRGA